MDAETLSEFKLTNFLVPLSEMFASFFIVKPTAPLHEPSSVTRNSSVIVSFPEPITSVSLLAEKSSSPINS